MPSSPVPSPTVTSLVVLAALAGGCRSGGQPPGPAAIDNHGGAVASHAPCYPDRATVTARELFDAATQGRPGSCRLVARAEAPDAPTEGGPHQIVDGDREVATVNMCGLAVVAPGITDDRGVAVGDPIATLLAAYPPAQLAYHVAAGADGRAQLSIHMGGLDLGSFGLDGKAPAAAVDGDAVVGPAAVDAIAGQHVASYFISFACD